MLPSKLICQGNINYKACRRRMSDVSKENTCQVVKMLQANDFYTKWKLNAKI